MYQLRGYDDFLTWSATSRPKWDVAKTSHTGRVGTNLNEKFKNIYVIRKLQDKKNNKITQKKDKNAIKYYKTNSLYITIILN